MAFEAFLAHEFAARRGRNARYSLRSFARDLKCDHASLSQWLRGKRKLTPAGETRRGRRRARWPNGSARRATT